MKKISIICVYNNREKVKKLLESLHDWKKWIDWILLDNRKGRFSSAAVALNFGVRLAKTDIFVFIHQDIIFKNIDDLAKIYSKIKEDSNCILGVAGVKQVKKGMESPILSNIHDGANGRNSYPPGIKKIESVFTLDECLIATSRRVMKKISFDEKTCNKWHFYGVDLCLQAHQKNICVYVLPIDLYHLSHGTYDKTYYKTEWKIAKKWKKKYQYICTTTAGFYTDTYRYWRHFFWNHYPWMYRISVKLCLLKKILKKGRGLV